MYLVSANFGTKIVSLILGTRDGVVAGDGSTRYSNLACDLVINLVVSLLSSGHAVMKVAQWFLLLSWPISHAT